MKAMTITEMAERIETLEKDAMIMNAFRGKTSDLPELLQQCTFKVAFVKDLFDDNGMPDLSEPSVNGLFWILNDIEEELQFILDNAILEKINGKPSREEARKEVSPNG